MRAVVRLPGPVDPVRTLARSSLWPGDLSTRFRDGVAWCGFRTEDGPVKVAYRRVDEAAVDVEAWGPGAERALSAAPDHLGALDHPERFQTDDPVVAPLRARFSGIRFGRSLRPVERAIATIIAQKVTGEGARRSHRDLLFACGERAPGPGPALWILPTAERLRELAYYDFHPFGIERKRARTILEVVRRAGRLERLTRSSPEEAVARLSAIRGIGPWTLANVRSAVLGDPDAVAVGDYNLPHLVTYAFTGQPRGTDERMLELLEPFRPHRGRVIALFHAAGWAAPRFGPRLPVRDIRRS